MSGSRAFLARVAALVFFAVAVAGLARADANDRQPFDIAAQPLAAALSEFARQSRQELLFSPDIVAQKKSAGVRGTLPPLEALGTLLKNTGISFSRTPNGAILLRTDSATASAEDQLHVAQSAAGAEMQPAERASQNAGEQRSGAEGEGSAAKDGADEEIVVTAQKRSERLQDVPVPVTAVKGDSLFESNQLRLQDYYTRIPGLSVTPQNTRGSPLLAIRGITTGDFTNPSVGVTVDDVPFGSSTFIGGGYVSPDIDPSDLARVEVLRGPQGALYGVSSIGGLIKFVTVDPSTDGFTGRVQAGMNSVENGDELGYSVRGSVNVPVTDTFAVRASGYTRRDPGYVDNVQTGEGGVNRGDASGGRLSALWRPSDVVSLKLSALIQEHKTHGSPLVYRLPGLGELQQDALRGSGGYDKETQAYSANLNLKLGRFDLTAVSGYGSNRGAYLIDYSPPLNAPTTFLNTLETDKFTQEVRLSMPIGARVEWLFGAFYTHEKSTWVSDLYSTDAATAARGAGLLYYVNPTKYAETALFADLTFHVTDTFDVQVGGRGSRIKQTSSAETSGVFIGGGVSVTPRADSQDEPFTYLVTPRWKPSQNVMVYARFASGYRSGGPNANFVLLQVPSQYDPDTTQNYDLGIKADLLERALTIDASLYYIDWQDIQVTLPTRNSSVYVDNGGRARSKGLEVSLESRPVRGLTLAAWAAWNSAELAEDFPVVSATYGRSGNRLPFSPRFSGNFSIDQEFPLGSAMSGFVGASVGYVGERRGGLQTTALRQIYPAYTRTDLRAGIRYDSWTVNLFANNLADKRSALVGGLDGFPIYSYDYIRPRTIGLSVAKTF